ncbi:hypothetical protein ABT025_30855 [Streptomyces sp. NPDC002809]|uniref:hypothetical protein n=1 Tax=Streptomyces sp. NPDC002809 TaxID=3154433 RepID=UPI00332ED6E6
MKADIQGLADVGGEVLLVGGVEKIPGIQRVPSNAGLRRTLGGTLTSLNVRMAASWLEHCEDGRLTSTATSDSWQRWASDVAEPERYNRTPISDEDVMAFIKRENASHPGISRSRLLRALRDGNQACEQSRFANLYIRAMGER